MTDRAIKVGDLVHVVKSCCEKRAAADRVFGVPWRVASIESPTHRQCRDCGFSMTTNMAFAEGAFGDGVLAAPLPWIKRIPPLDELEGQRTEESLRQPTKEPA